MPKTDAEYHRPLSEYFCIAFKAGTLLFQRLESMECQTTVFRIQKNCEKLFTMHAECLLSIKSFKANEWNTKSILQPLFLSNSTNTPRKQKRVTEFRSANS